MGEDPNSLLFAASIWGIIPREKVVSGVVEDSSLSILSLLLEEAMDFPGDRGRGVKGRIDLDPFFPQVDEHTSQWG